MLAMSPVWQFLCDYPDTKKLPRLVLTKDLSCGCDTGTPYDRPTHPLPTIIGTLPHHSAHLTDEISWPEIRLVDRMAGYILIHFNHVLMYCIGHNLPPW